MGWLKLEVYKLLPNVRVSARDGRGEFCFIFLSPFPILDNTRRAWVAPQEILHRRVQT